MFCLFSGLKLKAKTKPINDQPRLPVTLVRLCEALQPIQLKLDKQLEKQFFPHQRTIQTEDPASSIYLSIDEITTLYPQLIKWVESLNRNILANEYLNTWLLDDVTKNGSHIIDSITGIYRRANMLNVSGEDKEAADWLAALVKHNLIEINNWLIDLVGLIDKSTDLNKHKTKRHKTTLTVTMLLVLSSGPEVRKLKKYLTKMDKKEEAKNFDTAIQKNTQKSGWSKTTWFALGLFTGSVFFGGNKNGD